jgi:hypothetical protein
VAQLFSLGGKARIMKIISIILLIAILTGTNGCMTYSAVQEAKGHQDQAVWLGFQPTSVDCDNKSHPGYYFLIPLTVPADIVTFPFQAVAFFYTYWNIRC